MAFNLKDSDQYVFETPDLVETTTAPTTTVRSPSPGSDAHDHLDDSVSGIDTGRVRVDQSRSTFQNTRRRGSTNGDKSGGRYYYKPARSRHNVARTEFDVDSEDDDDDESTEARLVRLTREIEEVKQQVERQRSGAAANVPNVLDEVAHLQDILGSVYLDHKQTPDQTQPAAALDELRNQYNQARSTTAMVTTTAEKDSNDSPQTAPKPGLSPDQLSRLHAALSHAAEFDARLGRLEAMVGLDSGPLPETTQSGPPPPILSSLAILDKQVSLLTSSPETIQAAIQQIQQLMSEADRLDDLNRRQATEKGSRNPFDSISGLKRDSHQHHHNRISTISSTPLSLDSPISESRTGTMSPGPDTGLDAGQIAKIDALYDTLPTIQSLSGTLPLILERLRTLRLVHSAAGSATETMSDIDARLREQQTEIKMWQSSLDQLEKKLDEGENVMKGNVDEITAWVRDLEKRVDSLA